MKPPWLEQPASYALLVRGEAGHPAGPHGQAWPYLENVLLAQIRVPCWRWADAESLVRQADVPAAPVCLTEHCH